MQYILTTAMHSTPSLPEDCLKSYMDTSKKERCGKLLKNRKIWVSVRGKYSNDKVLSGMPHGSVLGHK